MATPAEHKQIAEDLLVESETEPIETYLDNLRLLRASVHARLGDNTAGSLASSQIVNVRNYGAVGDGTTNDTTAFNNAITAAAAMSPRGRVYVPPGTYIVTGGSVVLSNTGDTLVGDGSTSVIKRAAGGSFSSVIESTANNILIQGLVLDGNEDGVTGRGAFDAVVANRSNIQLRNLTIQNASTYGVRIWDTNDVIVDNVKFSNCKTATLIQARTQNRSNVVVSNCFVDGSMRVDDPLGIYVRGSQDGNSFVMTDVRITDNIVRLPVSNGSGICIEVWCQRTVVSGNNTYGAAFGISQAQCIDATIVGNTVETPGLIGIEFAGGGVSATNAYSGNITGNTVMGDAETQTGISISGLGFDVGPVLVTGNVVYDTTNDGIAAYNAEDVTVSGNDVTGLGRLLRFQDGTAGTATGNRLKGLNSSTVEAVYFENTPDVTVTGNHVIDANRGVVLYGSSGSSNFRGTIGPNNYNNVTTKVYENLGSWTNGITLLVPDAAHDPSDNNWSPADQGVSAWTSDPAYAGTQTSASATQGRIYYNSFVVRRRLTGLTKIHFTVGTAAVSVTGQNHVGIYTRLGVKMTSTSIDTELNSTGTKTATVPSFNLDPGTYWVAWVFNATGVPRLAGTLSFSTPQMNINTSTSTRRVAHSATDSQTSLPASITPATDMSQSSPVQAWFAFS